METQQVFALIGKTYPRTVELTLEDIQVKRQDQLYKFNSSVSQETILLTWDQMAEVVEWYNRIQSGEL